MSAIQQALLAAGVPTGPSPPLDGFTTGLWAAYGISKLLTAYAGSCLRVRRSSDNTEQDIGFVGNALDTAALATFVTTNSGFVTKWYDQSGNTRDAANVTTTKQPRIVNAGVYDAKLVFDGTDDCLVTPNSSGTVSAITAFMAGKLRATPNTNNLYLELGVPDASNGGLAFYQNNSANALQMADGAPTTTLFANYGTGAGPNNDIQAYVGDRTLTGTSNIKFYINGTVQSAPSFSGGPTTGNFAVNTWNIGSRNNGTIAAQLDCRGCVLYESSVSAANIATISAAMTAAGF